MLTPAFDLSQDSDFLTIAIRLPYARVSEFDVYFEGVDFKFYAKPYFLRLTLPGRILENGSEQGSYDADKGIFTIRLPKETPGQHFEGLNMLTALLAPRKSRTAKPLVEEMGASEDSEEVEHDDEEFDWEIEQTPYEEVSESTLHPQCRYGFGNLRSGVVQRLQDELSEVIDIKNPDDTPAAERRQKRLAAELAKFDPDYYLADFFEGEAVEQILKYSPWWNDTYSKMLASFEDSQEQEIHAVLVSFSEEEKYQLRKFVNKSYLLDKTAHHQVYYSLIDILLAYCYEIRVTEGERSVESAWSIRKLSPTLCWFETWTSVHEILVAFGRRVLCYPLYRHFKLVTKAHRDTVKILQLGKSAVLKCLLDIHKIFQENDPAYILNDLYISDYCVWIQKTKSEKLSSLAKALKEASLTKAQLGLELEELEAAALLVQKEETGRKAACSASTQTLGSSPESSDSEGSESELESESGSGSESELGPASGSESGPASASSSSSSSSSSSGPEDPASEQEELRGSLSAPATSLQGPFVHTSTALLVGEGVACVHTACQTQPWALVGAPGTHGPLIEELGEQLRTTLQVSQPEDASAGGRSSVRDSDEATGAQSLKDASCLGSGGSWTRDLGLISEASASSSPVGSSGLSTLPVHTAHCTSSPGPSQVPDAHIACSCRTAVPDISAAPSSQCLGSW